MPSQVEDIEAFRRGLAPLYEVLKDNEQRSFFTLEWGQKSKIAEAALAMLRLKKHGGLTDDERRALDTWIWECRHVLHRELEFRHLWSLQIVKDIERDGTLRENFLPMLVAIQSIRVIEGDGPLLDRRESLWDKVEQALSDFARQMSEVLTRPSDDRFLELLLLLNAIETLHELQRTPQLDAALGVLLHTVMANDQLLTSMSLKHPALGNYVAQLSQTLNLGITPTGSTRIPTPRVRAFALLHWLERLGKPPSDEDVQATFDSKSPHLWWVVRTWTVKLRTGVAPIFPFFKPLDLTSLMEVVWGDTSTIFATPVTSEEERAVHALDDGEVRKLLGRLFENHPRLTPQSRASLSEQVTKANMGLEVSDFNLEFQVGMGVVTVGFPIKAGAEVGKKKVGKITLEELSQFVRPLLRFGKESSASFPIVLSGETLAVTEEETILHSQLHAPIQIIRLRPFTQVLKAANLLPQANP